MLLSIRQVKNITINQGESQFVFVKRKFGFKVISQFYKNGELIFESSLYTIFLRQIVEILYQDLPNSIVLKRVGGWYYSLFYNESVLSIKVTYFRRPVFKLFKDGKEIGSIGNPKLVSIESRYYEMNTDIEDESINLYFLILFVSQLRGF